MTVPPPPAVRLTITTPVRLTEGQHRELEAAAAELGLSPARLVQQVVERALRTYRAVEHVTTAHQEAR